MKPIDPDRATEGSQTEQGQDSPDVIERMAATILGSLGEDIERDGLRQTPKRYASVMRELTQGYGQNPEEVLQGAMFDVSYDEMVIVKDIEVFSLCEHHMLPFFGRMHIAYIPHKKVIGLSKAARIVDIFARRLQIQERLTQQVAETIQGAIQPAGVGVVCEAQHLCMMMRGVEKQHSATITSAMMGVFRDNPKTREEFLSLVSSGRSH